MIGELYMKIGKLKVGRKAVNPVIATLLMIAIAVAAGILVYVWSMGLVGTLQAGGGEQTKEQVMMEAYDWTTTSTLILHMRNVGTTQIDIAEIYVEGNAQGQTATIAIDGTADLTCGALGFTPVSGRSYSIKVVTSTGAVFSFSAICGRAA